MWPMTSGRAASTVSSVTVCFARGSVPLPQRVAPELDEVRVALAVFHHRLQGAGVEGDVVRGHRFRQSVSGGAGFKPLDTQQALAEARPERGVHLAEALRQPRRARQHQQKGRGDANLLAGVEQRAADILGQRVRFVEKHRERPSGATRRQRPHEGRGAFGLATGRGGHAGLPWQPARDAASRRQGVDKRLRVRRCHPASRQGRPPLLRCRRP